MFSIQVCALPQQALLAKYAQGGNYTDCYTAKVAQAKELASGVLRAFAAWRVEERSANQLLMCDLSGRTRSWFMVTPAGNGGSTVTRLYFGSAVVAVVDKQSGQAMLGFTFKALLGFHKLYSRALLSAARSRLAMSALRQ